MMHVSGIGVVDEFRVYDRVLTGAEVLSLYEDPLACGKCEDNTGVVVLRVDLLACKLIYE